MVGSPLAVSPPVISRDRSTDGDAGNLYTGKKLLDQRVHLVDGTWVPTPSYSQVSGAGTSGAVNSWHNSNSGTIGSGVEFATWAASCKAGGDVNDDCNCRIVYDSSQKASSGGGSSGGNCVWTQAVTVGKSWSTQFQGTTGGGAWVTGYGCYGECVISGYP